MLVGSEGNGNAFPSFPVVIAELVLHLRVRPLDAGRVWCSNESTATDWLVTVIGVQRCIKVQSVIWRRLLCTYKANMGNRGMWGSGYMDSVPRLALCGVTVNSPAKNDPGTRGPTRAFGTLKMQFN